MAGLRNFNIGYFRATFDDKSGETTLHRALLDLISMPHEKRERACGDDQLRLQEYSQIDAVQGSPELYFGELIRMRNDLAIQSSKTGNVSELRLAAGQYLSECTHLLVDPKLRVMLYHGAPTTIAWTQFRQYIQEWNAEYAFELYPAVDPTIVDKLDGMDLPKKITIKVANPDKWASDGDLPEQILGAKNKGIDHMEITYFGPRSAAQSIDAGMKKVLSWLMKNEPEAGALEKAIIEGYANADATERTTIDLVRRRIVDQQRYDPHAIATFNDHRATARNLLVTSYRKHRDQLLRLYTSK